MGDRSVKKPRPANKESQLLNYDENQVLFRLLGRDNYTLASGVVQLLFAQPLPVSQWSRFATGVVCLVKDYAEKAYFIRVYDILNESAFHWEQQLYEDFSVDMPCECLLTFEGNECVVGLNFSSVKEAQIFKDAIDRRTAQEQRRKSGQHTGDYGDNHTQRLVPQLPVQNSSFGVLAPSRQPVAQASTGYGMIDAYADGSKGAKASKKGKKAKKLTKEDISLPTNFQHKVHVGWNPDKGFEATNDGFDGMDPNVKELLEKLGFSNVNLKKKDLKIIYQTVEQWGGQEAALREIERLRRTEQPPLPPPPPQRAPPVPSPPVKQQQTVSQDSRQQHRFQTNAPPPPPRDPMSVPRQQPQQSSPSLSASRAPPVPSAVPPPPPPQRAPAVAPQPVAPPSSVPPAPPPPPPPPVPEMLPTFASSASSSGGGGSDRGALLAQIQEGKKLRPVQQQQATADSGGDRGELLKQIRNRDVTLRPVETNVENRVSKPDQIGGLAGALMQALAKRRPHLEDSDDSSNDEDEEGGGADEDDWE